MALIDEFWDAAEAAVQSGINEHVPKSGLRAVQYHGGIGVVGADGTPLAVDGTLRRKLDRVMQHAEATAVVYKVEDDRITATFNFSVSKLAEYRTGLSFHISNFLLLSVIAVCLWVIF